MRQPPPHAILSQDGQQVAHVDGTHLLIIDAATGQTRREKLPHQASQVAFSPDAQHIAVANHELLSLFHVGKSLEQVSQAKLPAKPYRLTTAIDGTTIATFVYNDEEGVVGLWQGTNLTPLLDTNGHSLGAVLPDFVWLDAPHKRFLIWGQQGTGAFSGTGQAYIRLFEYGKKELHEVWEGQHLDFAPNGFVMPLTETTFAVYDRKQISVYNTTTPEKAVHTYRFDNMETVVSSPNGKWLVWLWNTSATGGITYHLTSLRLGTDTTPSLITFDHMGAFEKFAIADDGKITLVYGKEPKQLHIFQSKDHQLMPIAEIDVKS